MSSFSDELLNLDRERINVRAGLLGLVVLSVFGVAVAVWGPVFIAAAMGALVLLVTDPPPPGRRWVTALLPLLVAGTAMTFLAVWVGARPIPAAILVGIVGVVAAIHAGDGRKAGIRGLIATIWVVLALTLDDTAVGAVGYAAAFAGGALLGGIVTWLRARRGSDDGEDDDDIPVAEPTPTTLTGLFASRVGQFALLRGVGLAVAVLLGFILFPAHPAWVAISTLIVMRPPTRQALVVGLQRSLGTGVGVIAAVIVAGRVGDNRPGLIILFLASAFLAMAFREANYALFAMFVTALVVYSQRILGADAAESGQDRFVETVVGVAIAFIVLAIAEAQSRKEL